MAYVSNKPLPPTAYDHAVATAKELAKHGWEVRIEMTRGFESHTIKMKPIEPDIKSDPPCRAV